MDIGIQSTTKIRIGGVLRTIKQPPPTTITSTIQPAFQQSRNQVIDYPLLSTLLQENVFCRTCVSKFNDEYSKQTVRAFVTYLQNNSAYHITMEEKCDSFLEQALLEKSVMQPLIVVSSETYGLASGCRQNNMFDLPKTGC